MKCLVCIPSNARPNNIKKYVEPFMSRLGLDYKIFVEPQDKELYKFSNVVTLDANDKGLGYATSFAKNYAEQNGYELFFRIDDDVSAIGNIENDIHKIIKAFDIPQVGAVVFPYDFEWYSITNKLFTRKNKRLQTCYLIRTKALFTNYKIKCFEDFYYFMMLRKNNYDTLFCSRHFIKCPPIGTNHGGLQEYDRSELALASINIFKSIDSTIKVISKPDKPWKYEPKFTGKKYKSKPI